MEDKKNEGEDPKEILESLEEDIMVFVALSKNCISFSLIYFSYLHVGIAFLFVVIQN